MMNGELGILSTPVDFVATLPPTVDKLPARDTVGRGKNTMFKIPSTPSSVAVHPSRGEFLAQAVKYNPSPSFRPPSPKRDRIQITRTQPNSLTLFNKSCTELVSNRLKAKSFLPKSLSDAPR